MLLSRLGTPVVTIALALAAPSAHGVALFSADASFTVSVPGAVVNTFGFARIGPTFSSGSGFTGNATASATQGTTTVDLLAPAAQPAGGSLPGGAVFPDPTSTGIRVTVDGMSIDGQASPDGSAFATSTAALRFNLGNLTGSGTPTPAAQTIVVPVEGSYTFSEAAAAGGCTGCDEEARASFHIVARLGTTVLLDVLEPVTADFVDPTVPFSFLLTLPPNSVTPLTFDVSLEGFASASEVIKNPEPGSLLAMAGAIAGLHLVRAARARRQRG